MYSLNVKNYKKVEIESASQGKLLLRLFEGALEFLDLAKEYLRENDDANYKHYLGRAQAIITELMATLNMDAGGEIARNLFSLYEFMLRQLIEAYRDKNIENINGVRYLLSGLKESWEIIINGKAKSEDFAQAIEDDNVENRINISARPANAYAQQSAGMKKIDFSG
ncbi:MAG: flagellar export chaperone FliS [Candidatus Margulisiibacteriota bacterium]|nr:MAG: flagellar export chaperone FliS [Candidatus Margulisbacteria bacterium GWD2_39_127]OGI05515.1 MAG: flagellar export chaperone FliS [Candidatus Margulisbacteria bacterium GWF2_38_17]OGI08287.1 MAG: flagellar export chaperone FliS [Candidatus Margulisbacteria bacterium GWE2_39_32]PZM82281.1 MAG: flagellar export chaperone FliS [Candidatus Margulisiibacteriota bacterium]HAR62973.1 flagellar export chaperone FliS [Candidatus Margulisiibacteriota bacterium]